MKKKLIIGIGNTLMQDEGVGVHFVNYIKNDFTDFEIIELGSINLSVLQELEDRECVIFVDSIKVDYPEDYIFLELEEGHIPLKFSLHEVGIRELMGMLRFMNKAPKRAFVFGIKPYSVHPYMGLSTKMQAKLPLLKEVFQRFLLELR